MIRPAFLLVLATTASSLLAADALAAEASRPGMGKVVAQKKKAKKKKKGATTDAATSSAPAAAAPASPATPAAVVPAPSAAEAVAAPAAPSSGALTPASAAPAAAPVAAPAASNAPASATPPPDASSSAASPAAPASAASSGPDAPKVDGAAVATPAVDATAPGVVDGPSDSTDLEALLDSNVVSGASRSAEKADDAPATTTTISADDLRRYGLRTLGEALNFLSLGMYSQDPHHAIEVGSRGVMLTGDYGNHVLLVVDGNIMNEPWNGTAYFEQGAGIPVEMIDHIEVITGAGSVLYGSYAMLGVINVVTKNAKDSRGVHAVFEASGSPPVNSSGAAILTPDGAGGTVRIGVNAAQPFTLAGKEGEYGIGFEYYGQNGPTFGFAPQFDPANIDATGKCVEGAPNYGPNAYASCVWGGRAKDAYWAQVPTALAKARWGDFSTFVKATQYTRSQPARNVFGITAGDFNSPDSFERDRTLVGELKWQKTLTPELSAMARLYGATYDYVQKAYSHDYAADGGGVNVPDPSDPRQGFFYQGQTGVSQWGGLELQGTYDFLGDGRYPLLVGIDNRVRRIGYADDFVDVPTGKSYGTSSHYDRVEWLVAPYVQQRAKLSSEWQVNGGIRVDAQTDFSPALSPRLAAVYTPASIPGTFKAVGSSAFRTPTGYERFTAIPGEQVPNAGLTPERVWTAELSYERRIGKLRALGGVFYNYFTDMVAYGPSGLATGENWFANSNAISNVGFNGLVEGSYDQLRYGATLTVASTSVDAVGGSRDLPASPTFFGNVHASYELPKPIPVLSTALAYIGPRYADVAYASGNTAVWRDGALAPTQLDWRITATGDIPQVKGLTYRVMTNLAVHDRMPYAVGPVTEPSASSPVPVLSPVNRFTLMGGLQYDLDIL